MTVSHGHAPMTVTGQQYASYWSRSGESNRTMLATCWPFGRRDQQDKGTAADFLSIVIFLFCARNFLLYVCGQSLLRQFRIPVPRLKDTWQVNVDKTPPTAKLWVHFNEWGTQPRRWALIHWSCYVSRSAHLVTEQRRVWVLVFDHWR